MEIELPKDDQKQIVVIACSPGIGSVAAKAIIEARHKGHITELSHLQKLHIRAPDQVAPYILLNGHKPVTQMALF